MFDASEAKKDGKITKWKPQIFLKKNGKAPLPKKRLPPELGEMKKRLIAFSSKHGTYLLFTVESGR